MIIPIPGRARRYLVSADVLYVSVGVVQYLGLHRHYRYSIVTHEEEDDDEGSGTEGVANDGVDVSDGQPIVEGQDGDGEGAVP